jgi:hypothetical protein
VTVEVVFRFQQTQAAKELYNEAMRDNHDLVKALIAHGVDVDGHKGYVRSFTHSAYYYFFIFLFVFSQSKSPGGV